MSLATRWVVGILIVMQLVVLAGMVRRDGPFDHVGMDYLTTWVASNMVLHGDAGRLYDTRAQWAYQLPVLAQHHVQWDDRVMHPYLAPPPLALIGLPLALFPPVVALVIWMVAAGGAVGLAIRWLASVFQVDWRAIAPLVAGSMPLFALLMLGQADGLLALAFALFAVQVRRGNEGRAGIALAALAIKPQLLVAPLVYLLVTGRRRAVVTAGLAGLAELAVSIALIGPVGVREELRVSRRMSGPAGEAVIHVPGMLNIRAAVARVLPSDTDGLMIPLVIGVTLAVLALSAWIWRQYDSHEATACGIGLLAMTMVLTAFHAHYHSGVIALIGIGLVVAGLRERGEHVAAGRLVAVTWASFAIVPLFLFLSVESTPMPAAIGTFALLGMWSWTVHDLALRPSEVPSAMRVTAPAVTAPPGDRPGR